MSALPSTSQPPSPLAATAASCQLSRASGRAKLSLGVSLVAKEPLLVKAGPSIRGRHPLDERHASPRRLHCSGAVDP